MRKIGYPGDIAACFEFSCYSTVQSYHAFAVRLRSDSVKFFCFTAFETKVGLAASAISSNSALCFRLGVCHCAKNAWCKLSLSIQRCLITISMQAIQIFLRGLLLPCGLSSLCLLCQVEASAHMRLIVSGPWICSQSGTIVHLRIHACLQFPCLLWRHSDRAGLVCSQFPVSS